MLEMMLIAAAWKRGWRGWALLPPAIAWPLMFGAAANCGAAGLNVSIAFDIPG